MYALFLALICLLVVAYVMYDVTKPPCQSSYEYLTHDKAPVTPQSSYLDVMGDALFTEGDKESHSIYTEKRNLYGDHTLRLDAIPAPTNTNFIGLRKPRKQNVDPYAAQQLGVTYNNSEAKYVRLV